MTLSKREFLQVMVSASVAGMALSRYAEADTATAEQGLYDLAPFGNVCLLHMTDCHAQLKPVYFREPSVNLGLGGMQGQWPHRHRHSAPVPCPQPTPRPSLAGSRAWKDS